MRFGPLNIQAPLLLLGVFAAAIPLLLHLLAKVRAPAVFFPTLRFLRMSMDKTARRRRVQHWLLLLLRMLALAVLAMAVAQPLVQPQRGSLGSDRDTAAVLILDNSLSMQVRTRDGPRFELAKAAVARLLAERNFQEVGLIVTNGPPIGEEVASRAVPGPGAEQNRLHSTALTNPFKLKDMVKNLVCGTGQANLLGAVKQAQQVFAGTRLPNREIYLFTDLQESSAAQLYALANEDKQAETPPLLIITPGAGAGDGPARQGTPGRGGPPKNLAITKVELDQSSVTAGQPVFINVTVRNFWDQSAKATVTAFVDGQEHGEYAQPVAVINPNAAQVVPFRMTFAEPGPHTGYFQVRLDDGSGADDLPADDRRYFSLDVADRVNALLITPRHEVDKTADAGFWIGRMVAARQGGETSSPFRFTEVTAADNPTAALLDGKQVVVTCDLADLTLPPAADSAASQPDEGSGRAVDRSFSADRLAAYRRFVADGGTWMIFVGPSVDLAAYNELLTQPGSEKQPPLLDGRLVRYVGAATGGVGVGGTAATIQSVDLAHPMFMGFYPSLAPYRRVQVYRYAEVQLPGGSASRAIAEVNRPGGGVRDPLVIETPYGRGRVLLFTTAVSKQWTSWFEQPQGQGLVIRQMMLAAGNPGLAALADYHEGDQVTMAVPGSVPADASVRVQVRLAPDGAWKEAAVERDESGRSPIAAMGGTGGLSASVTGSRHRFARFSATEKLGVYQWRAVPWDPGRGRQPASGIWAAGAFAVNVPPAESDLHAMDPDRLAAMLPGRVVEVGGSVDELADKIAAQRKGSPLWPYLLAGVLVLLAVEAKIANRGRPATESGLRPAFVSGA